MRITEKTFPNIDEKYTRIDLENGLTCFVIKKDITSYAELAVNFGSCDVNTAEGGEFPVGLAHFLEHKMFETRDGDAFVRYAAFGGEANAYTASDKTVYLFSCSENFYENFDILLDHVFNARFTKRSVEKEKGIISQEIMMYADNPRWRCHRHMLESLYGDCSLSEDPCGTLGFIDTVTPKMLRDCRRYAYDLSNMVICVCGDVDADKTADAINCATANVKPAKNTRFLPPVLSPAVIEHETVEYADVASPVFEIGIRFDNIEHGIKEFAAVEIIMNLAFGKSSSLYNELYEKELFEELGDNCQTVRNAFFASLSGISKDPRKLYEELCAGLERFAVSGFTDADFERTKKAIYADLVFSFESSESVSESVVSFFFENDDYFEYPLVIASTDKEFTEDIFKKVFIPQNTCISIIYPKEAKK